jgi:cell pole-organizing protein PopZ
MPPVKDVAPTGLTSESVQKAAVSAFSSLASTVQIDRLAGPGYVGNGSRTLEDMVTDLMRPLLKEWLDQNLPATVDRLVQKEIERIARRVND